MYFFGVVEVIDCGGYGRHSYQAFPADTKEEALMLLGQKMLQFPSYSILSLTVYDEHHEKVYYSEQRDANSSRQYIKNHHEEHARMSERARSKWEDLYNVHNNINDHMYGGKELTI